MDTQKMYEIGGYQRQGQGKVVHLALGLRSLISDGFSLLEPD